MSQPVDETCNIANEMTRLTEKAAFIAMACNALAFMNEDELDCVINKNALIGLGDYADELRDGLYAIRRAIHAKWKNEIGEYYKY